MTTLRQLVERYAISGQIDFQTFRRAFVMDFLAVYEDPAVLQIESECDDFEQSQLSELQLKLNLVAKCNTPTGALYQPIQTPNASELPYATSDATILHFAAAGSASSAKQLAGVTLAWEYV